jgi:hypothetical protein
MLECKCLGWVASDQPNWGLPVCGGHVEARLGSPAARVASVFTEAAPSVVHSAEALEGDRPTRLVGCRRAARQINFLSVVTHCVGMRRAVIQVPAWRYF